MILINFSHPLNTEQQNQVAGLANQPVDRVIDVPVQFDTTQPFITQVNTLVDGLPLSAQELQTEAILINLPALNFIAALLLAELHGRMGYFPSILRTRPVQGSLPPRFEVAEILNLQAVRDQARTARYS